MLKPNLPPTIVEDSFDTSYEFAQANFRGWWDKMKEQFGYSEVELIHYVTALRESLQNYDASNSAH